MKTFFYVALFTSMLVSCKKDNLPPAGDYVGVFTYTDPDNWDSQTVNYKIKDSQKDSLLIDWCIVYKLPDNKLMGRVPANLINTSLSQSYQITGEWKKVKKKYIITGTFTQEYFHPIAGEYTLHGTFEIKSQ